MTAEDLGQVVINEIIEGSLLRRDEEEPSLIIWSANAAEQIGMAVKSLIRLEATSDG